MNWQEWTNGVGCKITSFQSSYLCFWDCERLQAESFKIANVAHLQWWVEVLLCFTADMLLKTQNNMKIRLQMLDKTQIL